MADRRDDELENAEENPCDKKRRRFKRANFVLLIVACVVAVIAILFAIFFVANWGFKRNYRYEYDFDYRADQYQDGFWFYRNGDGYYTVYDIDDWYWQDGYIEIPSRCNGTTVSEICEEAFSGRDYIKSVTIPDSIEYIGDGAFRYCASLSSVAIGKNVRYIGECAFADCSALTDITVPGRVEYIGSYAFRNCSSMEFAYIPESVTKMGNRVFEGCDGDRLVIFAEASSEPGGWQYNWNPNDCTVFWGAASTPVTYSFAACGGSAVDAISAWYLSDLPTTERDGYMFAGWYTDPDFSDDSMVSVPYYSATDVTLYARWIDLNGPESEGLEITDGVVTGIGTCSDSVLYISSPIADYAFSGCSQISAVYLLDGCTSVGYQAFSSCSNLKSVYFCQSEMSYLASDIFANTWNSADFGVYVPSSLYGQYRNASDTYWQQYLVNDDKLHGF